MRKAHKQWQFLLWLMLAGLGCFLVPQFGPGQLPIVENRPPVVLGPPQEREAPQVLEFGPPPAAPAMQKVLEFEVPEPLPPPRPMPPQPLPSIVEAPGFALMPPLQETEAPELAPEPSSIAHLDRPTFGAVSGLNSARTPTGIAPVMWTSEPPIQVRFLPLADLKGGEVSRGFEKGSPVVWEVQPDAAMLARLLRQARERAYMDRLGSSDGTPRLTSRYTNNYNFVPTWHTVQPTRPVQRVLHSAFTSGHSVCETIAWPLRFLAQPYNWYD